MKELPSYILITPARNEAEYIELTIKSVISQIALPTKWIIVSDGSNDGTDDIVKRYAESHSWMELVQLPERRERHFAGKVHAFNAGYEIARDLQYDAVGSMDADISFDDNFFFFLLTKLADNPMLGLVGAPFIEATTKETYDYRFVSVEHVSGCCQLFRRKCFEDIGGYIPVKAGGIDHIAVITSRMKGWGTRSFPEIQCIHHRNIGCAQNGELSSRFKYGQKDYSLGSHPLWEVCRSTYQMTKRPYVVGGLTLLSGYIWALIRHEARPVSRELVKFHRDEQLHRLKTFFLNSIAKP